MESRRAYIIYFIIIAIILSIAKCNDDYKKEREREEINNIKKI